MCGVHANQGLMHYSAYYSCRCAPADEAVKNMRRVAGARRPNLCASLACEKRHNSQAMSVDRHPDRIASTQISVCAGGAVTLEALRLAQATIPVMDTSVGYP